MNTENDSDRLSGFIQNYDLYAIVMVFRQRFLKSFYDLTGSVNALRVFEIFVRKYKSISIVIYWLVLLMSGMLFFYYDVPEAAQEEIKGVFKTISILLIVVSAISIFIYLTEIIPIYFFLMNQDDKEYSSSEAAKNRIKYEARIINKLYFWQKNVSFLKIVLQHFPCLGLLFNKEVFFGLLYFTMSILCYFQPLLFPIFFLIVQLRTQESLFDIIRSITKNLTNIVLFSFVGLTVLFIYGVILYYNFQQDCDGEGEQIYCDNFTLSISTVIKYGFQ